MVLLVGGQPLAPAGSDARRLLAAAVAHPTLRAAGKAFLSERVALDPRAKCVHVLQGEAAAVALGGDALLGTSDFTTCVAAALVSPSPQPHRAPRPPSLPHRRGRK